MNHLRQNLLAFAFALTCFPACGGTAGDDGSTDGAECIDGHESCPCAEGGVCLAGLSCVSDVCVDLGDGDGGTGADPLTTTGDGTEALWHYNDIDECQLPLWCYSGGNPLNPAGGELWAFECFETGLAPPVTVYKFAYEVVANSNQLQDFQLQLRAYDPATGPGALLNARTLDPAIEGTVESHGIDVGWTVDASDFCIGFHAPAGGLGSALGLAVDETATVPDVSWFRIDDGSFGSCGMIEMADVMDTQSMPQGNWCFAVAVSNLDMP